MSEQFLKDLRFYPTVFVVKNDYQIFVTTHGETTVSVRVGEKLYHDSIGGIVRTKVPVHIVTVPQSELDKEKEYTVIYQRVLKKNYYGVDLDEPVEISFGFKPVPDDKINVYHIADSHRLRKSVSEAGKYFGEELDLLIFNGDVYECELEDYYSQLMFASEITKGARPVIASRGNHDVRGSFGEDYAKYNPTDNGLTYFTFRVGSVWGIVLDCGEDAADDYPRRSSITAFRPYKEEETEFVRAVAEVKEYEEDGIKHRLLISHHPIGMKLPAPYDIDEDLYEEWSRLVYNEMKPTLSLFGHTHETVICEEGGKCDAYGYQKGLAVIGSRPDFSEKAGFIGCAIVLKDEDTEIFFTDEKGNIV